MQQPVAQLLEVRPHELDSAGLGTSDRIPARSGRLAAASPSATVLDSVVSEHSKRNYAKALDHLFGFLRGRPIDRALLMEWRSTMEKFAPSTVNVRLSAMRKLVTEARRSGMLSAEEADHLTSVPNIREKGTRLGNWLTREQAKKLLQVPDRSSLKGKRDYVILALLVGCALRRKELAWLLIEDIQIRDGRWVIADLRGKGGGIRTVAVPVWVKQGINAWTTAAEIEEGRLLRAVSKSGKLNGHELSDWAIWSVVEQAAKEIGIERFGAHDLRRTCAKLCRKSGGTLNKSSFYLGIPRSRQPSGTLAPNKSWPSPSTTISASSVC